MKQLKIYFFGDSICFGQYISIHKTFVSLLSSKVEEYAKSMGLDVIFQNPSISGNTSRQALERISFDVQGHSPDILFVQFGLNDCNYWVSDRGNPRVSPESFASNIQEIIKRALSFGAKKIVMNTNHPTTRSTHIMNHTKITYQTSNELYNQIIRDVVMKTHDSRVLLNDIEAKINEITTHTKEAISDLVLPEPDQLHLSEAGHRVYFEILFPLVKDIINQFA